MERRSHSTPAFSKESSVASIYLNGLVYSEAWVTMGSSGTELEEKAGTRCLQSCFLPSSMWHLRSWLLFGYFVWYSIELVNPFSRAGAVKAQAVQLSPSFSNATERDVHWGAWSVPGRYREALPRLQLSLWPSVLTFNRLQCTNPCTDPCQRVQSSSAAPLQSWLARGSLSRHMFVTLVPELRPSP